MIDESMMRSPLPPWTKRQSSGWFPREIARTGSVQHRMKNGDFMVPLIYETYGNFIQILYLDDLDVQFFGVFPNISHIFHGILYLDESGFCMFLFVDDKKYQWGHPIGPTLLIGYPLTSAWIYKSKLQFYPVEIIVVNSPVDSQRQWILMSIRRIVLQSYSLKIS